MNIFPQGQQFGFGEVIYPLRRRTRPKILRNVQMVIVHSGGAIIEVDAREATVLLPDRQKQFVFSAKTRGRHMWCEAIRFSEVSLTNQRL
jgi:hypothetical protein